MECSFNSPSGPLTKSLGWKTICELVDEEPKLMVYKSVNGLAPQYLHNLFIRNSFCSGGSWGNSLVGLVMAPLKATFFCVSRARDRKIYIREVVGVINFRKK